MGQSVIFSTLLYIEEDDLANITLMFPSVRKTIRSTAMRMMIERIMVQTRMFKHVHIRYRVIMKLADMSLRNKVQVARKFGGARPSVISSRTGMSWVDG